MRALGIAATGMKAQEMNVAVISGNIANLGTTGYKRSRAEFQDLIYQNFTRSGTQSSDAGTIVPTGVQLGLGVKPGSVYRVNQQGTLVLTENKFDLALSGRGYFQITLPDGDIGYTRDGSFQVDATGTLVTSDGYVVSPGISVPQDAIDVDINQSGEVIVKIDGQQAAQNVGQIDLVTFINDAGLEAIGDNLFLETAASGTPTSGFANTDGFGIIEQGFLEQSNVDSVTEITMLITAQRAYELNSRVISTSDEMLQAVSQLR